MQTKLVAQVPSDKQLVQRLGVPQQITRSGRNYVYIGQQSETVSRRQRAGIAIRAFIKTIPFGIGLFFKSTREDWKAVFTGKKIVAYYQEESPALNVFKQTIRADQPTQKQASQSSPSVGESMPKNEEAGSAQYIEGKKLYNEANRLRERGAALFKSAEEHLKEAADLGHAEAQYILAKIYEGGYGEVEKNQPLAFQLYQKSAEKGYPKAERALGRIYSTIYADSYGVNRDVKEAFKWYKKAADQGDTWSLLSVGNCYANGQGVEKDTQKAIKYYNQTLESPKGSRFELEINQAFENIYSQPK